MSLPANLEKLLDEYAALAQARAGDRLTADEEQRLELLRDVILEMVAALDTGGGTFAPRAPRVPVSLEVSFGSALDAARALTRDLGTGGLSIATPKPLAKGVLVMIRLWIPTWPEPLVAKGEVAWSTAEATGVAFREL